MENKRDIRILTDDFHPSEIDWMDIEDFEIIADFYDKYKIQFPFFYCVLLANQYGVDYFDCLSCPLREKDFERFYNFIEEWDIFYEY